jgi:hypothetical protein
LNIKEITDQAITLSGVPIDAFKSRRFINEAMQILAGTYDNACIKSNTTIICTDVNSEYPLPDDCIGVTRVMLNNQKFNNYIIEDGNIIFDYTGTFSVRYIKTPSLTDRKVYQKELNTDIPSIDLIFHRALPFYVAAQVLYTTNPDDKKAGSFIGRFNSIANDVNSKLDRPKRKGARMKAPLFR